MSSPGVFTFRDSETETSFYIHQDADDLPGIASHLLAMTLVEAGSHGRQRGNLATRFLVANREFAEIVNPKYWDEVSILVTGDSYEDATVLVTEQSYDDDDRLTLFEGRLIPFINKFARRGWIPERYQEVK